MLLVETAASQFASSGTTKGRANFAGFPEASFLALGFYTRLCLEVSFDLSLAKISPNIFNFCSKWNLNWSTAVLVPLVDGILKTWPTSAWLLFLICSFFHLVSISSRMIITLQVPLALRNHASCLSTSPLSCWSWLHFHRSGASLLPRIYDIDFVSPHTVCYLLLPFSRRVSTVSFFL